MEWGYGQMKILLFLILMSISANIISCPTKLANELLCNEEISFRDVNKSLDKR